MPPNCSADVEAVISHIDTVFHSGPQSEIDEIKENFGLTNLTHLDDVAAACTCTHLPNEVVLLTASFCSSAQQYVGLAVPSARYGSKWNLFPILRRP